MKKKLFVLFISLSLNVLNVYADFKETGYYPRKPTCLRPHLHRIPQGHNENSEQKPPSFVLELIDPRIIEVQRKGVSNFFKDKQEEMPFDRKKKSQILGSIFST